MNREPSPHSMTVETERENVAECRTALDAARKEIARLGSVVDQVMAEHHKARGERDDLKVRNEGLIKACDDYARRFDCMRAMFRAALDAV